MATERILSKEQTAEMGFLRIVLGVTLRDTKSTCLKSVKPGMPSHFFEARDPRYVSSAMCPERAGKDWRSKTFGLVITRGKIVQKSSKHQVAWLHLRPCLVSSWCGASRSIFDCYWSWGISGLPRSAAPSNSPQRKTGHENERMSMQAYIENFYLCNCF